MTSLKPVALDVLMPLMTSSLDAAAAPAASARATAATFVQRFADHDAVGAVHTIDDATRMSVAQMVTDLSAASTTIGAVHGAVRHSGAPLDTLTTAAARRVTDGANRLATLPTNTPRNIYMAAVSAEKTAIAAERALVDLKLVVGDVAARLQA